jgi:hypothetical protein
VHGAEEEVHKIKLKEKEAMKEWGARSGEQQHPISLNSSSMLKL